MISDERKMARTAETAEAESMLAFSMAAPDEVRSTLGMRANRVAGGVVCTMERDPMSGFWSRALGHGFDRPLNSDVLDEILENFREGGVAVGLVQTSPSRTRRTGRTCSHPGASPPGEPG